VHIAELRARGWDQNPTRASFSDEGIGEICARSSARRRREEERGEGSDRNRMVAQISSDNKLVNGEKAPISSSLLVVLEARGVKLDEVYAELERRHRPYGSRKRRRSRKTDGKMKRMERESEDGLPPIAILTARMAALRERKTRPIRLTRRDRECRLQRRLS